MEAASQQHHQGATHGDPRHVFGFGYAGRLLLNSAHALVACAEIETVSPNKKRKFLSLQAKQAIIAQVRGPSRRTEESANAFVSDYSSLYHLEKQGHHSLIAHMRKTKQQRLWPFWASTKRCSLRFLASIGTTRCHCLAKFVNQRSWTSLACSSDILGAKDQGEKCAEKANPHDNFDEFDTIQSFLGTHD